MLTTLQGLALQHHYIVRKIQGNPYLRLPVEVVLAGECQLSTSLHSRKNLGENPHLRLHVEVVLAGDFQLHPPQAQLRA